jgi:hypothetical protein
MIVQQRFDDVSGRLHKAADNLCRMIGAGTVAPSPQAIDSLVAAIDACTATATTLAAPPIPPAAAKRTRARI